jgi:hypothetical protein
MKKIILQVAFVAGLVLAMDVGVFMTVPSHRSIILWVASGTIEAIPVEFQKDRRIPSGVRVHPSAINADADDIHYMDIFEFLECGYPSAKEIVESYTGWEARHLNCARLGNKKENPFSLHCKKGKWDGPPLRRTCFGFYTPL